MLYTGVVLSLSGAALGSVITSAVRQSIYGIGASGAWWPYDISLFPQSSQPEVARLLFDPVTGLGMTDYRYNLGGGGVGVGTADRAPKTPYISDGVYNFSADPQGTYFLRAAAQYNVPIITLFVNSAPITMTNSSQNCGGTLITERIPAYAQYLTDVIKYWYTQGVKITHVSPMNEPDNNFDDGDPTTLCGQEGMQVTPEQRAQVVNTLAAALGNASLPTKVIADESSSSGTFIPDAPIWLSDVSPGALSAVAHHQYGFANDTRVAQIGSVARDLSGGLSPWFTEICCYSETDPSEAGDPLATIAWGQTYDPTMVSGLRMANLIWQSFTQAEDGHWDWWTALSGGYGCTPNNDTTCATTRNYNGWDDGLIYYDPNYATTQNYNLTLTKRFHVLKHYISAVPIGATRVNVTAVESNWRVVAFNSPGTSKLHSVVAFNGQHNASTLTLTREDGGLLVPNLAFMTDPDHDYVPVELSVLPKKTLVIDAPPMSIFTIFF
ncbi:glycoside hydrolase family 30 protein [Neolentinus lepideus HHB14362 ss-1]|uniref:Glycoside hydrolase family 30 protein n=1 Tax=Neolentinus lepideus HHB14362 ss-1 TaxID=1314782 RepID=A0A165QKD3_9AGAM|nr:glycoside hydrolase family 30 protein [Neolentinus lepideus HHB14362 ss-1]